jgi:hypothetical protein
MGTKRVSATKAARAANRAAKKAARARAKLARRQAWRQAQLAKFRANLALLLGPQVMASTRELAGPVTIRVMSSKQPIVMKRMSGEAYAAAPTKGSEEYRARFAAFGGHVEVEFALPQDSPLEIKNAAYEAAKDEHGDVSRTWVLVKVEGTNQLGREALR